MLFSQRKGLKTVKNIIQVDSIDSDLRSALWNAFFIFFMRDTKSSPNGFKYKDLNGNEQVFALIQSLFDSYFRRPLDEIPEYWNPTLEYIKEDCSIVNVSARNLDAA